MAEDFFSDHEDNQDSDHEEDLATKKKATKKKQEDPTNEKASQGKAKGKAKEKTSRDKGTMMSLSLWVVSHPKQRRQESRHRRQWQ